MPAAVYFKIHLSHNVVAITTLFIRLIDELAQVIRRAQVQIPIEPMYSETAKFLGGKLP